MDPNILKDIAVKIRQMPREEFEELLREAGFDFAGGLKKRKYQVIKFLREQQAEIAYQTQRADSLLKHYDQLRDSCYFKEKCFYCGTDVFVKDLEMKVCDKAECRAKAHQF